VTALKKRDQKIDDIKDPRWLFGLLIIATIMLAFVLALIVNQYVTDRNDKMEWWKIIFSAASLSVSLFLGSIVAIHAYRYVNRLSHDWKIRHDYAVDRLDRLYGPLWDETKCITKAIESYYRSSYFDQGRGFSAGMSSVQRDVYHVQRYEQLANSHLQLFLTESVLNRLKAFHESVAKYDSQGSDIRDSMAAEFRIMLTTHKSLMNYPGDKLGNLASTLWSELSHDSNLGNILNSEPDPKSGLRMRTRFAELLRANLHMTDDKGSIVYDDVIGSLRKNEHLEELRSSRKDCLEKGESLLIVLKDIVERPESALD
jgi:hypothetical protein